MNPFKRFSSTFFVVILFLFTAWDICGQDKEAQEDSLEFQTQELTIIGTRTVEKLIDIPYSVFSVDKKELAFGRKVSAKDVLADVPGLFLQSRYGNQDLRLSIRGFGTRSNSGIRGVRILQDGIPESEPDGETVIDAVDLNALGGVEVVKGNLSSLYANAPGGVVNFVSDLYFPQNYFTVTNQTGKYGYRQNGFKLGLKTNENRFLLTYNYRNLDGYRAHSKEYRHLINAVYETYLPKSTLTILGNFVNGMLVLPGSLTKDEFDSDPMQANPYALSLDYKRITKKGRLAVRYKMDLDQDKKNELELTGYGGIKELESAGNPNYTFATRYSLGSLVRFTNTSTLFGRSNIFTCGVELAHQAGPVTDFENFYGQRGTAVNSDYTASLSNTGAYFLNHFNLLPEKLDLFLSGRFDRNVYEKNIYIPILYSDNSRVFEKFAPKAALNFKITPEIALYTSYGIGFDFPALSELNNNRFSSDRTLSLNPDLGVQKSGNFELGIKGKIRRPDEEFMRKLKFDVTFFHYTIDDEIVPFRIFEDTYYRNAAKTNRIGIELGFMSEPFEGIELTVNYTITKFKYDRYDALIYTASGKINEDYTGSFVPSVPRNILNFILNYEYELSEDISGLLQWDCDYIGSMYVDDKNTAQANSFFYGNAMAGITYSTERYGLLFYAGAGNIFDKRYSGFVNINDFNQRYYETGEPRTIHAGLNLTYKF